MFGLARAFSRPPPLGEGVLVISIPVPGGCAADALSLNGMKPAGIGYGNKPATEENLTRLRGCNNPVDFTFDMNAEQVRKTIEIGLRSKEISSVIVILQAEILDSYVKEFKKIDFQGKPILSCVPCKEFAMNEVIELEQSGIPVYSTPEEAAEVLSTMYRYGASVKRN